MSLSEAGLVPESKILCVVGQHPVAPNVVVAVFERRGHSVETRGLDPMPWYGIDAFDLVVLEIDGTDPETLNACASLRQVSKIPLILLVPPNVKSQAIRGLQLGADGYLVMPCDRRELAARAEALIRRRSAIGPAAGV